MKSGKVVWLKVGERQSRLKSPGGTRTKAIRAIRVQCSSGSRNARWRGEPGGGNTDLPERDTLRGSAEKADREQLNDERGVKPLPVSRSRDGAESGKTKPGRIRGCFCILTPEISSQKIGTGNYGETGVLHIPGWTGR